MDRSDPHGHIPDYPGTVTLPSNVVQHDDIACLSTATVPVTHRELTFTGHEYQPLPHRRRVPIPNPSHRQLQKREASAGAGEEVFNGVAGGA
jgi:hypothetical protein